MTNSANENSPSDVVTVQDAMNAIVEAMGPFQIDSVAKPDPVPPAESDADDGDIDDNVVIESNVPTAPRDPHIQLFTLPDLLTLRDDAGTRSTDHDIRGRNRALVRRLQTTGPYRHLHRLPGNWRERLDAVEIDYPHFAEFLAYVRTMCGLAAADNGVVEMEWALLDGPPGTGKSTVVARLRELIGSDYVRVSMAAVESGAHIGGSQEFWTNSKTGMVFTTLTEGIYANPIFMLDELDKVSADTRYDPLGPLYELLEPALATRFCDLSVPSLPIDASRIVWVATSNHAEDMPDAIRQRFVVFKIPLPTPAESLAVARSVVRELKARHPRLEPFTLDADVFEVLAGFAPREMKKRIHLACGQAALDGRKVVSAADFPPTVQPRRMGF